MVFMNDIIYEEAIGTVKRCGSRDPLKIARELGIRVLFDNDFGQLKGMYKIVRKMRFIFLNGNMDELTRAAVCAHELGHDRLHQHLARVGVLRDYMMYDMQLRPEYEANVFASNLLIDDEDILLRLYGEQEISQIAGELEVDMNLVAIKIEELRKQGHKFRAPFLPQANFMGKI